MRASILVLVFMLAFIHGAHADSKARAKALYDQGLKHYNVAEYTEAIQAWKDAYLLSKKPLLLFNIAQAYRLSGDCKQAMTFYDSYQREEPSPKNQDELEQALALCKPTEKEKPVDKPVEPAPPPKPVEKKPAPIVAPPPPVSTTTTTTGGGLRKIGIGVAAAGVLFGGASIYMAIDSKNAAHDLDGYTGEWGPTQMHIEHRGQRSALLGWVFGGLGAAAAIAGGVMIAIGGPKEVAAVSVAPTHGGVQVGWSWQF